MPLSNYSLKFEKHQGRNIIVLVDMNVGPSLTNTIDKACEQIAAKHNLKLPEYTIVYRDSNNKWDVYHPSNDSFQCYNEDSWQDALNKYFPEVRIPTLA